MLAICLALVFRTQISLEERDDDEIEADQTKTAAADVRPKLNTMLYLPAAALAVRAMFDLQFVEWLWPWLSAAAGGIVLAALIGLADPKHRERKWSTVFALIFMTAYAYGALAFVNKIYDANRGECFETTVTRKHTRRTETDVITLINYYVIPAPWGPKRLADEVSLDKDLYESLNPGDRFCIDLHPGRLGWQWYEAQECW